MTKIVVKEEERKEAIIPNKKYVIPTENIIPTIINNSLSANKFVKGVLFEDRLFMDVPIILITFHTNEQNLKYSIRRIEKDNVEILVSKANKKVIFVNGSDDTVKYLVRNKHLILVNEIEYLNKRYVLAKCDNCFIVVDKIKETLIGEYTTKEEAKRYLLLEELNNG